MEHFAGPLPMLAPLMVPIEIISHLARILSLALRLFGNIFGEHTATGIFFAMFPFVIPWPMMGLGIFGALLQAFIFIMLTMAYLQGAVACRGALSVAIEDYPRRKRMNRRFAVLAVVLVALALAAAPALAQEHGAAPAGKNMWQFIGAAFAIGIAAAFGALGQAPRPGGGLRGHRPQPGRGRTDPHHHDHRSRAHRVAGHLRPDHRLPDPGLDPRRDALTRGRGLAEGPGLACLCREARPARSPVQGGLASAPRDPRCAARIPRSRTS